MINLSKLDHLERCVRALKKGRNKRLLDLMRDHKVRNATQIMIDLRRDYGDIVDQSVLSNHVNDLYNAGFLTRRRNGKYIEFQYDKDGADLFAKWVDSYNPIELLKSNKVLEDGDSN